MLKKRSRRKYSEYQLSELTKRYQMEPHTNGESLASLSERLDMSIESIKGWLYRKRRREI